jgi:hypothetical protein
MTRLWLAALLLGGCSEDGYDGSAEGEHLVVHVTSDLEFDHVDVTLFDIGNIGNVEEHLDLPRPRTTWDYDHWELQDGPRRVRLAAQDHGAPIGAGEANIDYRWVSGRVFAASITMHLTQ